MSAQSKGWMKLDNAAKIYPAARRRNWSALFRMSMTLDSPVDTDVLERALSRTLPRFPAYSVHLKRGLFWFYLEHTDGHPDVTADGSYPCELLRMNRNKGFAFRVRYYENRIAVEFFHALTDGSGGMSFLKTLVAEYLEEKHGIAIPRGGDLLDCKEAPKDSETEDSFIKNAGRISASRSEKRAFRIRAKSETDFVHITTGTIPVDAVLAKAREKRVTITQYLSAVLILAIDAIQRREVHSEKRYKPVKICVPINLRPFYSSTTTRNFASYVNPGIDPRMGEYSLDEVTRIVFHQMGAEVTEKQLNAKFSTNVLTERNAILRVTPLFVKNIVLKAVFAVTGDRRTSSSITNLGRISLPPEMEAHVTRMDLILGPLSVNPVVCAALSYKDVLYLNFTRTITDPKVEREFFTRLVKLGIPVTIESNSR